MKNTTDLQASSTQQQLESDQFFLQVIQSLSTDLLFRYNIQTDTMYYFGATRTLLALPECSQNYGQMLHSEENPNFEDATALLEQIEHMKKGVELPCDFRFCYPDGNWIWHRKEYRLTYDQDGQPLEAIGRSCNIQEQKDMETQINFDRLTGCFRKEIFEAKAAQYMRQASQLGHALLIIDLDNFKAVNDFLGHQYGDKVLRETGDKLKAIFRTTDLVGRIGGDEFMVFMKNISDEAIIAKKVNQALKALDVTYKDSVHEVHVSASIGVARYPQHGATFAALYNNADTALFDAKNRGKNAFVIYKEGLSKGTMDNTLSFDVATRALSQHFDYRVVAECFALLFGANDVDQAVDQVLSILGNRFEASRVYVFEANTTEIDYYINTYEWCAHNISPEKENLQHVPRSILQPFFSHANDDGIIYCNDFTMLEDPDAKDIMDAQGIKSFLHAYLGEGDSFTYTIGFDDCDSPRVWSPLEIATLLHVSKIIAQFINYKNALRMTQTISDERLSVLDSLNYAAYIIEADTHRVTYFNKYTQEKYPHLKLGDICYEQMRGKDCVCDDCALHRMGAGPSVRHVIYNECLQDYHLVNANRLPSFAGKESVFMCANELGWILDAHLDTKNP